MPPSHSGTYLRQIVGIGGGKGLPIHRSRVSADPLFGGLISGNAVISAVSRGGTGAALVPRTPPEIAPWTEQQLNSPTSRTSSSSSTQYPHRSCLPARVKPKPPR